MSREEESNESPGAFLPLLLMGLALLLGLFAQFSFIANERNALLRTAQMQEQQLAQIKAGKGTLQKLAIGLVELSKTNPNAKAIVQKHGITTDPNSRQVQVQQP